MLTRFMHNSLMLVFCCTTFAANASSPELSDAISLKKRRLMENIFISRYGISPSMPEDITRLLTPTFIDFSRSADATEAPIDTLELPPLELPHCDSPASNYYFIPVDDSSDTLNTTDILEITGTSFNESDLDKSDTISESLTPQEELRSLAFANGFALSDESIEEILLVLKTRGTLRL